MSTSSLSSPELGPTMGPDIRPNFSYKNATHDEVLEDLSSRFILNLPDEELASLERISFQVEQAHWFYEDFIREQNSKLPSLSLKKFSAMLFNACPLLHHWSQDHEQAFNAFMQYKTRVPVCGAIMLNDTWDKCVLVKGWKSSSGWGFPKGKINEQEPPSTCAVREVLEETGYNLAGKINPANLIEMTIKEQRIAMFIVPSVPEDYVFKTKTRKEISKIEWFKLSDLPTWKRNQGSPGKFYLISPFIGPLKAFIHDNKPHPPRKTKSKAAAPFFASAPIPEADEQSLDSNQESSSQTSSADNGGPSTPSPQSVEANRVVHQEEGMPRFDSHFAALLSNLTDSISAEKDQKESLVGNPVHTPTPETSPESQPAVHVQSQHYPPYMSPPESTVGSFNSQSTVTPRTRPKPPSPSMQPSNHSQGASSTNPPTSDPTSLRPAPSRRSTVADISPYLRKQVPPQTTPSHLRRLALLEGIANESARLTPRLDEEERRLSSPSSNGFHFPPVQAQDHGLLYSSGRQSVADVRVQGPPSNYPHDVFQVRPRTSMSTHRPPLGFHTGSMNSNQVMSMMQMQSPLQHPPPPLQSPMGYGPIPFTGPYSSMAPNYQQYAPAAHPMYAHHPGFGHPPPPPHAPRAGMPLQSSFGPAASSSNSAAGTLLSILNGTPASSHAS